jgi:undecaprenyl-diphosphatase
VSATSLLHLDDEWSRRLRLEDRQGRLRTLAAIVAHSGDSWFWGIGLGAVFLGGDSAAKTWAITLVAGIAGLAIIVMGTKLLVRRRRPAGEWGRIYRSTDPHSFPSGHAARAFLVTVLVVVLGPAWLALLLVVWAPLVSLARVAMGVHYLSDVVAGALLGTALGVAAVVFLPL